MLLALGLAGRFAAGVLFIFNIIAVLSYPALNAAGIEQHQVWGIMLLVTLLHGPGRISIDHWIATRWLKGDRSHSDFDSEVPRGPEIQDRI